MDWLSLFLRWFHVIAGVAWIGASFYFIWLDNNLQAPPQWKKDKGIKGDLWAVHGGGFYEVAKYEYGPEQIPPTLHWFKWEAYTTWISGFCLLVLVYYFGASAYLVDPRVYDIDPNVAIGLGLSLIFGGLFIYEIACRSPLANYPVVFALFLMGLLTLSSWLATSWFSGRGAFIHVGALVGTIMAGNVLFKIIPSQRLMVDAVTNKKNIDPKWGADAKLRSVHNNYLTLPLLFIMISNHYPMTYQHADSWLVLLSMMAASAWIRHYFNLKHIGIQRPSILIQGGIAMMAIAFWVSMPEQKTQPEAPKASAAALTELDKQTMSLIETHCVSCHSSSPTDEMFVVAPLGVTFDNWQQVVDRAPQIMRRTVLTKDMPLLNKSNMTEDDREIIKSWFTELNR